MEDTRPILLIGTPYYGGFTHEFVISSYASLESLHDKYKVALSTAESAQVHLNRNIIFECAYKHKVDYLLFIDTDMAWLPSHIERLVKSGKDVIGGLCTTRKEPLLNCVYENDGRGLCRAMTKIPTIPFRCFAIGTGFLLIRKPVIQRMWGERFKHGYPFDPIAHGSTESIVTTLSAYRGTDISFCQRLRKLEIDIWCDPTVRPGHMGKIMYGREEFGNVKCDN